MRNEIMTFRNEAFGEVRTMCDEKGEPWFVGKDVAEVLGYSNPNKAVTEHVDAEDCISLSYKAFPKTGKASLWVGKDYSNKMLINESGLYSLIMASNLPQAKDFKRWVTGEVLPQIRKTGGYIPVGKGDDEKTILAKTVRILLKTVEQKVQFAEAVMSSDDCIYIGDLAKLISSNGIAVGRVKLFGWLRRHKYMFKDSRNPIQKWVNRGLLVVEETVINNGRRTRLNIVTKVTAKGQQYFVNGFVSGRFRLEQE